MQGLLKSSRKLFSEAHKTVIYKLIYRLKKLLCTFTIKTF